MNAILILGAAVWAEGPSPTLRRRTQHACKLWQAAPDSLIIPCGGLGQHPPTEAAAMRSLLLAAGVAETQIRLEDQSTNTMENIDFALPILQAAGVSKVTIVTDLTHAPRARMVARHYGLDARIASPSLRGARPTFLLRQTLRELVALPLYALRLRRRSREEHAGTDPH